MTSDKLKALRETLQREAPNALADLSMSDDEYSGVEEWARCCPACGERGDCEHKLLGRALVKIELQKERIAELEIALRDIASGKWTGEGCESIARSVLEKKP
jgi:hypothetical protein